MERVSGPRGTVQHKTFQSVSLNTSRDIWVYTPHGYVPTSGPYPLIILFDGRPYLQGSPDAASLNTLDNLIGAGRMRPAVVCFVDTTGSDRNQILYFNESFASAIARELIPMLRSSYAVSNRAEDVVVGGYSAGGVAAAFVALNHSAVIGNVLAQSGAFGARHPTSLEPNYLAQMYRDSVRLPIRFFLEYGLYETMIAPALPFEELALIEPMTQANRRLRDVLIAKGYEVTARETGGAHNFVQWSATLADGLMTLLAPQR